MKINREWISISDMMAGLMMVFLFISVLYMIQTKRDKLAMAEIALTYERSQTELNKELCDQFAPDLDRWGAEILPDNTVRFKAPEVLFAKSSDRITAAFESILDDFFPRYIRILTKPLYKEDIAEVRIEGHTSSEWESEKSMEYRYLGNAWLSQNRAYSVLEYAFLVPGVESHRTWLTRVLRANGLSFANLRHFADGSEDRKGSRRVEFRVITKTEEKIFKIIDRVRGSR